MPIQISPENTFAIIAVFFGLTAICISLEKTAIGKRISAVMMVVFGAMALSNLGILPKSAPFYGFIWSALVPLAIALFLIKADLVSIFTEGGRVLAGFCIGALGVIVGALAGVWLADLGPDRAAYAAVITASYTGGSLNFAAVADMIGFTDPSKLAAAVTLDNVLGISFIILTGLSASLPLLRRRYAWRTDRIASSSENQAKAGGNLRIFDLTVCLALAAACVSAGQYVAKTLGIPGYSILFITLIMVGVATVARGFLFRMQGEDVFAMLCMYLFFAMIGTGVDISAMLNAAPPLFILIGCILLTHAMFMLIGARLLKLNYAEMIIASIACIGGPTIASPLAILFGWHKLAVPGIVTGVFGYVIGNFFGVGIFEFLS